MVWSVTSSQVSLSSLPFNTVFSCNVFDKTLAGYIVGGTWESRAFHMPFNQSRAYGLPSRDLNIRKRRQYARSQVDPGSSQDGFANKDPAKNSKVGTRLSRMVTSLWNRLVEKFVRARKRAPLKVFSLLLGYYSANAVSTLVGQTGDWDVIVVGMAVALMEGISFLTYRLPPVLSKFQDFICMLNFWKVGLSLGFILDKFKLESEDNFFFETVPVFSTKFWCLFNW